MARLVLWIERLEIIIACVCLPTAAAALCADVISRELFGQGLYGVQKFAVYCCAISGALGISIVVHRGGHLRISAVDALLPTTLLPQISRLGDAISAAGCLFLAYYSFIFVRNTFLFQEVDTILDIPIWRVQMVLPIAFTLAAIKYLMHAAAPTLKPTESAA